MILASIGDNTLAIKTANLLARIEKIMFGLREALNILVSLIGAQALIKSF